MERNQTAWVAFIDSADEIREITPESVFVIDSEEGITTRVRRKARRMRKDMKRYAIIGVDPDNADAPENQLEYLPPHSLDWKYVHDMRDAIRGTWYTGIERELPAYYAVETASENPAAAREKFTIVDGVDLESAKRAATRNEKESYSKYLFLGRMEKDGRIKILCYKKPWAYRWTKVQEEIFCKGT